MTVNTFADVYGQFAKDSEDKTGVPFLATLSQAALESSWGKHAPGNNFFGIKADSSWTGDTQELNTHEVVNGKSVAVKALFRKYDSPADSFIDHGNFLLQNKRYAGAFQAQTTQDFIQAIADAGYATDPKYATKLNKIVDMLSGNNTIATILHNVGDTVSSVTDTATADISDNPIFFLILVGLIITIIFGKYKK
jgi:flagellar protein FlgJ